MRRPLALLLCCTGLALGLTGCLPEPVAESSPPSTPPTAAPSADPSSTSSASPSASPSASTSPTAEVPVDPFPIRALADVCVTGALESGAAPARTDVGRAERQERGQDQWAIAVPGVTDDGSDVMFLCTLSGTSDDFQLELRTRVDGALDESWTSRLADIEAGRG